MEMINYRDIMNPQDRRKRGASVYHLSQTIGLNAVDKDGKLQQVSYNKPLFSLTLQERIDIAKYSAMIFGVVSNRMARIGSLDWTVKAADQILDEDIDLFEDLAAIYREWDGMQSPKAITMKQIILGRLLPAMPDLRPDLENFRPALSRYAKRAR